MVVTILEFPHIPSLFDQQVSVAAFVLSDKNRSFSQDNKNRFDLSI